jgi:ATP/maltotriose-dependent transcriptional regulator MalT
LSGVESRPYAANRIVGRDGELQRLAGVLAAGDGARVALVGGEAGIGKTRLVTDALASSSPTGALVIALRGDPVRRSKAFDAFTSAVEAHVRDWTSVPPALEPRRAEVSRLLAPVTPALDTGAGKGDEAADSMESLERAAIDVLRHLAPDLAPVIVYADDLHWIDPETIGIVHQLVLGVPGLDDVVVIGTYRPDGLLSRSPLSALLNAVERRPDGLNIRLDRLGLDEVADFAAQALGDNVPYRAVKALHHRSGGNPFFLEELIASSGGAGATDATDAIDLADLPLPWTVAELLRDAVLALTDDERVVIESAAVLGQRVPFDLLARVTGSSEGSLIDSLRGLVAAGLLVEDEDDVFAFRHALVGETVSAGLLGRERRRIHEAALAVLLEADEPDDVAIAHHAAAAGAVGVMLDAVRRAATDAVRRGAAYQALELAELGLSEAPEDSSLNELATRAAWLVGALDDAAEHASRWVRTSVDRDDLVDESRARRLAMRVAWDGGDDVAHAEQHRRLATLVDRMPEGEDRAAALADLAQANMLAGRVAATIDYADRAIAEARAIGSERVHAQALVERWSCSAGEGKAVVPEVLAAVDRAEALGDHVTAARGLNNIVDLVAVEQRRAIIERMRANAESAGFAALAAYSYAEHLSELASLSADRAELDRWLTHAWRWRRLGQCRKGTLWLDFYSALLEAEAGDAVGTAADPIGRHRTGAPRQNTTAYAELVEAASRGDARSARTVVEAWASSEKKSVKDKLYHLPNVVEAALRAGVPDEDLREIFDETIPDDERAGSSWDVAMAFLESAAGHRSEASDHASRVGDEVERWLRGELELQLAELALAAGANADAAKHAMAARGMLARWPGWRRDRADGLVRRLERRAAAVPGNELSGRELEVAGLLADGLTNAQIAERLFIARKTAAVHVSNILAKLGMRSRTEIAAWAIRTGVAASDVERTG